MTRKHSNKPGKAGSAEKTVKDIRRATRKNYGACAAVNFIRRPFVYRFDF